MRTSTLFFSPLLPLACAFPTAENLAKVARRSADGGSSGFGDLHEALLGLKEKRLLADPLTTPIDVSGQHTFQPPNFANGDQRGPCPGLNALANHGYLSRDGVVGFTEVITAANEVYGMGIDLITLLSTMGTVGVGNPLALNPGFSIGGETPESSNLLGNLDGLLGTPRGLDGSHNWIEADSSNTRDDIYVTGNSWTMNMTLFLDAFNSVQGDVMTMDDAAERAAKRFSESIATNPYFYYGPYTGMIARNAGYIFASRFLSNHSTDFPLGGQMTKDVFMSFWGVVNENGQMVYNEGWERIPENWYRIGTDYGLVDLNLDLIDWVTKYPELGSIGGNLGMINSFSGVDIANATGGLLTATSLLEGNNLVCFVLEAVKTFAPNSLSTLFSILQTPLALVNDAIVEPLLNLSCPDFSDLEMGGADLMTGLLNQYPGASKSGSAF